MRRRPSKRIRDAAKEQDQGDSAPVKQSDQPQES